MSNIFSWDTKLSCVCKCSCDAQRERVGKEIFKIIEPEEIFIGDFSGYTLVEIVKMVKDLELYVEERQSFFKLLKEKSLKCGRIDVAEYSNMELSGKFQKTLKDLLNESNLLPQSFDRRKITEEIDEFWYIRCECVCECGNRSVPP